MFFGKVLHCCYKIYILYLDGIPANNAVAATIELSCLQLYSRGLSHGEIISSKDRCTFRGGYRVY